MLLYAMMLHVQRDDVTHLVEDLLHCLVGGGGARGDADGDLGGGGLRG